MGIGIHFESNEDDFEGPLFGRNWLDDEKHYCPQLTSSSESWDEIKARWFEYNLSITRGSGEQFKTFNQWLKENYNPPTRI